MSSRALALVAEVRHESPCDHAMACHYPELAPRPMIVSHLGFAIFLVETALI